MTRKILTIITILLFSNAEADNSIGSEFSHFAGGAVMAGGITAVVDSYYPEYKADRGIISFGISSAAIVVEQTIEYALHGDAGGQLLDIASHVAGSALGAWVTDNYILSPVVQSSASEGKYVGLQVGMRY